MSAPPKRSRKSRGLVAFSAALPRRSLRELGYVEGQTIVLELRWAEGRLERLPELVAELVGLKVDVLVVGPTAVLAEALTIAEMITSGCMMPTRVSSSSAQSV